MIVALIDNGSLEPAAHVQLRAVAAALSTEVGVRVEAVSWKHSDRSDAGATAHASRIWTLAPFVTAQLAAGEREFVFVPFFISAQGAIGSALRRDLEDLQRNSSGFSFTFSDGLAARGVIAGIVADNIRETIARHALHRPSIIVVDHGGPARASAILRDQLTAEVRQELGEMAHAVMAASLEGGDHAHNRPLLEDLLHSPEHARGDVVIAPLFLAPGRHAGPRGDLANIADAAAARSAGALRCRFTSLIGLHPRVVAALGAGLQDTLAQLPAQTFV